jgi:peptide/nickel transport system substrate-binding protein
MHKHKSMLWGLVLLLSLVACTSPQSPPRSVEQSAEPSPRSGGVLNLAERVFLSNRDPATGVDVIDISGSIAYNGLLSFKADPTVKWEQVILQPDLAERWRYRPTLRALRYLRDGVKFANLPPVNGRAVTSADVKFSVDYLARTGEFQGQKPSKVQALFQGLEKVETPDARTVIVRFADPFVPFLSHTSARHFQILAKEIVEQDGHLEQRTVGTGPWQWDAAASQAGARMVWKKNPTYWEEGRPYIDEIRHLVIPTDATAYAAFQTKQLDMVREIDNFESYESVRKGSPDAVQLEYSPGEPWRIRLNVSRPPLDDVRVRMGVALATDRDEMFRALSGGVGRWALASADLDTFNDEETKQLLRHDPQEARRLLNEAGLGGGVTIEYLYGADDRGQISASLAELFQAQMKRVGITVVLNSVDRGDMSARRRAGQFTVSPGGLSGKSPDIDEILYGYYHPKSGSNYGRVNDPRLTAMLEATRREGDPVKRKDLVREAVRYANEQVYGISWFWGPNWDFSHPYVKGRHANTANNGRVFTHAWLDK